MKYILNPAYLLRQDKNRVILYYRDDIESNGEEWFTFIHPFHAKMLSFFKGEEEFDKEVKKCASYFGLDYNKMKRMVSPFLENESWFSIIQKGGHHVCFPKKVLIKKEDNVTRPLYSTNDFHYLGEPDYTELRLEYPVVVNMELTMRCYTDCCYCYADRISYKGIHLDTSKIIDFIQEAKDNGVLKIDINGGEVLLHPGIRDILHKLVDCGYSPLVSSKIPLDKGIIDYIKSLGLSRIQLSLDSVDSEILTKMIKVDSSYIKRMESTLEYLSKVKLKTNINIVLTQLNASTLSIENLIHFLSGFDAVKNIRMSPCGYSLYKKNYKELVLTEKQLESISELVSTLEKKYPQFSFSLSGHEAKKMYSKEYRKQTFAHRAMCTGNVRNAVLLPNGDITICEELYNHPMFIIGNIKKNSLRDIWNSPKAIQLYNFAYNKMSDSICYNCTTQKQCRTGKGVCWKIVLMAFGVDKWDYPDPRCPLAPNPSNEFYSV